MVELSYPKSSGMWKSRKYQTIWRVHYNQPPFHITIIFVPSQKLSKHPCQITAVDNINLSKTSCCRPALQKINAKNRKLSMARFICVHNDGSRMLFRCKHFWFITLCSFPMSESSFISYPFLFTLITKMKKKDHEDKWTLNRKPS